MRDAIYTLRDFINDEVRKRNISKREFARRLDVAPSTLLRLLEDDPPVPTLSVLAKLSEITGVSIETLAALAYPEVADRTRISPTAQVVGQAFEKLPERIQEMILSIIRGNSSIAD